jgi:hypothetical protein
MLFVPTIRAAMVKRWANKKPFATLLLLNLIYRVVILNVINIGNLLGKVFNFISSKEVRK